VNAFGGVICYFGKEEMNQRRGQKGSEKDTIKELCLT